MAWDVSYVHKFSVGNKLCHVLSCVADAATQAVDTGLNSVDFFDVAPQSMAAVAQVYANVDASGAASTGYLGCSGFTSGDVLFIKCYGK